MSGALLFLAFTAFAFAPIAESQPVARTVQCRAAGPAVRVPDLSEGSGITRAQRNPGRAWALNDSGEPVVFAVDGRGTVTGRVRITGATVDDWEAIALGPCPGGACLYIGDIGDNDAKRERITIYRVAEPHDSMTSADVTDVFHARYPDGPQDAETLLVTPDSDILVVTKGETGAVRVYQFPHDMQPGATVELLPVGKPRNQGRSDPKERITDGAVSPNGAWVALRTNHALIFYATAHLMNGNWAQGQTVDLRNLGEPQGEGVAFADASTLYLLGEGGGERQPGTFGRLTCTF